MKIYYAHHIWKYGTEIEAYEIQCINSGFPDAEIINPKEVLPQGKPESEILKTAFSVIKSCDVIVFSTVSGLIGHGIFNEVVVAATSGVKVYQLHGNRCYEVNNLDLKEIVFNGNNRVYALAYTPDEYQQR